jgi:hypothetical protein
MFLFWLVCSVISILPPRFTWKTIIVSATPIKPEVHPLSVSRDSLKQSLEKLMDAGDKFLQCVNPDIFLVTAFMSELSFRDLELHELTRQQLMSPTLTDYTKNSALLELLQSSSVSCFEAFIRALLSTGQTHVVNMLLRKTGQSTTARVAGRHYDPVACRVLSHHWNISWLFNLTYAKHFA